MGFVLEMNCPVSSCVVIMVILADSSALLRNEPYLSVLCYPSQSFDPRLHMNESQALGKVMLIV